MQEKISCYIGFSVKAGKIIYGLDDLLKFPYKAKVVLISDDLTENSLKKLDTIKNKYFDLKIYKIIEPILEDLVHKKNCKLIALTDAELSKAVCNNINTVIAEVYN